MNTEFRHPRKVKSAKETGGGVQGTVVSHAGALELVARQHGARDWNTLHARLRGQKEPHTFALGDRVTGADLGPDYSGRIVGLSGPAGYRVVSIALQQVDTVRFGSFSNWRSRTRATVNADGVSHAKTSEGIPHLTISR